MLDLRSSRRVDDSAWSPEASEVWSRYHQAVTMVPVIHPLADTLIATLLTQLKTGPIDD